MNKIKPLILYLLVATFLIFEMGVQVSPSIMTDQLMQSLQIGTFGLGIMSGVYFYTYAAFQIPCGILFDTFNPRKIITISMLVCTLGALCFGLSTNVYVAAFSRLLMGAGSAFAFVSVLVVTSDLFHSKYFALLTGITQMLAAFGAMSGQIPLSHLVITLGWRPTMFLLSTIGTLLACAIWIFLKYQRENVLHSSPTDAPSIRQNIYAILKNPQTWYLALYACLLWAPISGFASLWGVPFLVTAYHLTHNTAAHMIALMWLGLALASPVLGWWSANLGRRIWPLAFAAIVGFFAFIIVLFARQLPIGFIGLAIFLAGGACSGQALSFSVVREINHPARRATAIAINNIAVVISGAFFQPIIGKLLQLFQTQPETTHSIYSTQAFTHSLTIILICYAIGSLIALSLIKETLCEDQPN